MSGPVRHVNPRYGQQGVQQHSEHKSQRNKRTRRRRGKGKVWYKNIHTQRGQIYRCTRVCACVWSFALTGSIFFSCLTKRCVIPSTEGWRKGKRRGIREVISYNAIVEIPRSLSSRRPRRHSPPAERQAGPSSCDGHQPAGRPGPCSRCRAQPATTRHLREKSHNTHRGGVKFAAANNTNQIRFGVPSGVMSVPPSVRAVSS